MVVTTASAHEDTPPLYRPCHTGASVKLRSIYDEMRSRQLKAITKAGALRSDPYFVPDGCLGNDSVPSDAICGNETVDDRRCLAISSIINSSVESYWTTDFRRLERRLHDEFGQYGLTFSQNPSAVGGGQLHWTLMQLVGFPDYEAEVLLNKNDTFAHPSPTYLSPEYLDCIQDSLTVNGLDTAIQITYVGVVVVATGLLMVGIPSLDINEARDAVRLRLSNRDLPLKEPFVNDIVHSTLFRVAGDSTAMPDDLHLRLIDLAKEFENVNLGSVVLDRFQIGPASWRVLPSEMEATPPVRTWTLPHETPREHYDATVVTEEEGGGRGCYTVSGASGANLAKELRLVLSRKGKIGAEPQPPPRAVTPPKDEEQDKTIGKQSPPPALVLDGMKNVPMAVRERIDSADVRDSVPQASHAPVSEEESPINTWDHAATVSGAGGLALAQELQKKLEEEKRALDRMYYTDFY